MSTRSSIWDELNNCELTVEHAELSQEMKNCISDVIERNLDYCLDPIKSKGHCLRISNELMLKLVEAGKTPFVDCKIIHTRKPQGHFWIMVDGWHIDLTARQFNPQEACPKIWKHDGAGIENWYYVEKGKDLVLFKLVPFVATKKVLTKTRHAYAKLKSVTKRMLKRLPESFVESPEGELLFEK